MGRPITINIPHQLGAQEARRRIEQGFGQLEAQIARPGMAQMQKHWEGERLVFSARMLGQGIDGRLDVQEDSIRMEVDLPEFLALVADAIKGRLQRQGRLLLEEEVAGFTHPGRPPIAAVMTEVLDYYAEAGLSAAFYDLVSHFDPTLAGDVDFYADLAPPEGLVLELGCGTGRVALALAERGFSVVGVDLAPAMLKRAEAKRQRIGGDVAARTGFMLGDMAALDLQMGFDAVIVPFFGFAHLPPNETRARAFQVIARHLKGGGRAAVHVPNAEAMSRPVPADAASQPVLRVRFDEAGRHISIFIVERRLDGATGRFDQVLDYVVTEPDGTEARRSRERLDFHIIDLEQAARASGLVLERKIVPFNDVGEMYVYRRP